MPQLGPIKRRDLIRYLKDLGFDGPYSGAKHLRTIRHHPQLTSPSLAVDALPSGTLRF